MLKILSKESNLVFVSSGEIPAKDVAPLKVCYQSILLFIDNYIIKG